MGFAKPAHLFLLGFQAGGERVAIFFTVLETATLSGLDPEAYLAGVIDRTAKVIRSIASPITDLLPWNWKTEPVKLAA